MTPMISGPSLGSLFADDAIAYIDAHTAAHGCFAARVQRDVA
ncbi:MAG: DUF1203 domain-containing protein [Sphingopyxis sp.]